MTNPMLKTYFRLTIKTLNLSKIFLPIFLILCLTFLATQKSFAKTSGNYISIDFVKTDLTFALEKIYKNTKEKQLETIATPNYGIGFKYNYAFNYKNIFISPGIFFENNNAKNFYNISSVSAEWKKTYYGDTFAKVNQRYGAKVDIGFDVTDAFSIYGTIGKAINNYTSYTSVYGNYYSAQVTQNHWVLSNSKQSSPLYGAGFRIKLFSNLLLNGEYNYSRFSVKTKAQNYGDYIDDKGTSYTMPSRIDLNNYVNIFKFGINYNF